MVWLLDSSSRGGTSVATVSHDKCFLGCFPPFPGALLDVGLGVVLLLGWISLPIVVFSWLHVRVLRDLLGSGHLTFGFC